MNLIKVAGETAASAVYINPERVTTLMQRADNASGLTRINTDIRVLVVGVSKPDTTVQYIWSCTPIESLVQAFGQMVRIKLFSVVTATPWKVAYVRLSAIVSIDSVGGNRADLFLTSGETLTAADVQDLAPIIGKAQQA
jgi:hypothetical protein